MLVSKHHSTRVNERRFRPRTMIWGMSLALALGGGAKGAENPPISIELNKLEPQVKACRVYIVVDNPGEAAFQTLKLDLVLFRTDGVIDRRLALDMAPIRPGKKSVKIFDLDALPCESIGSILINEVMDCRDASGSVAGCIDRLKVSSRAAVPFSK